MDSDERRDKCADAFDAIRGNEPEKLEHLLGDVSADIIDRNNKNNTLLHYAVEKGNKDIVELLLHPKWEVNIHATNIVGNTPLHIAVLRNKTELVRTLLSNGANSDIENDEGKTALDLARESEIIGILKLVDATSRRDAAITRSDGKNEDGSTGQGKTYEKREGTTGMRGELYEIEFAMLYLLHGITSFEEGVVPDFRLGANMKAGGNVGNLIFQCRYEQLNGTVKSKIIFVQTKHQENVEKKQPPVANRKDGWFLRDHFCAYLKVKDEFSKEKKDDPIFEGRFEDCEFVIFTNIPFPDYSKGYEGNVTIEDMERRSIFDKRNQNQYYSLLMGGNKDDEIVAMVNSSLSSEKTPTSSTKPVSRDEIDEYFGKLRLFCGQPNENELRDVIIERLRLVYRLRLTDANRVFAVVELKTRSWWIHGNEYLSENNRFFQDAVRVSIRFGVKKPVDLFTGRDRELDALYRSLERNSYQSNCDVISRTTCVAGLGGMGKTQLARKYVDEYSGNYDDNIIWMNAESDESLHREFRRFARDTLNIATINAGHKDKDISSIVTETYSFFAKRRSIFVFDNVEETKHLEDFLHPRDLLPDAERPHILITSRRNEWNEGVDVVELGEFTTTDAARFVGKGLGLDENNEATNRSMIRLVKVLQRFPLAIQQAISYIGNQSSTADVSIDEYLRTYERRTQDLLDWKLVAKDTTSDYEKTTYTTWKMTIEKIGETGIGELALEILDVIAHLASDDIRRDMFLKLACDNDSALRAAVRKLVNFSMVNGEQRQSILYVHRLVQQVTILEQRIRGTEAEIFRKTWDLLQHNLRCDDEPMEYFMKKYMLMHCGTFLSHFDGARTNQHENPVTKDVDLAHGLLQMSLVFSHIIFPKYLVEWHAQILTMAEEHHGRDDPRLVPILERAGGSYAHFWANRQSARDIFERILKIRAKQHGHNDLPIVETLVTMSHISKTFLGPQKQKHFIESALDIAAKLDVSHPSEISSLLYELAFGYFNYHHERRELFARLSAIEQPRSREQLEICAQLATLDRNPYHNVSPSRETNIDMLERALSAVRTYGQGNDYKARNMQLRTNLADIYGHLKDHDIQTKLLERAVEILEQDYGTDHSRVAVGLVALGNAYGELGDYQEKKVRIERALEIRTKLYGPDHIIIANTLINLADVYGNLNDPHHQEKLLERALNITEKYFGKDQSHPGHVLILLSIVNERLGNIPRQQELLSRIAEIWPPPPPNGRYYSILADVSYDCGNGGEACKKPSVDPG